MHYKAKKGQLPVGNLVWDPMENWYLILFCSINHPPHTVKLMVFLKM